MASERVPADDAWAGLDDDERAERFERLPHGDAADFFLTRSARTQAALLLRVPGPEQRVLLRVLAPDDVADVLQEEPDHAEDWLALLDSATRSEVRALLTYQEDAAGGVMNPRYVTLRPGMDVEQALRYVRQAAQHAETIYYVYVVDEGRLVGVVSLRQILMAVAGTLVQDIMEREVVSVREDTDQEVVARLISRHDLLAVPVTDSNGRMRGIVTVDDVIDVLREEATEDIHKFAGVEVLETPYLQTPVSGMIRKRGPWLAVLFVGQMLTAAALAYFADDMASALVLAVFLPLIISSGGNAGGQASTLVIRAMALGQVRLRDAGRVAVREARVGFLMGVILAVLGAVRILAWEGLFGSYGEHARVLSVAIGLSVVLVVLWGTLAGSMLPLLLRRSGLDPATASAPFVATLVDVTGVIIYFATARVVLGGTLL